MTSVQVRTPYWSSRRRYQQLPEPSTAPDDAPRNFPSADMINLSPSDSFDRFLWIQDFVVRLIELGAPVPTGELLKLGETQFETRSKRDPGSTAEHFWGRWATDGGSSILGID